MINDQKCISDINTYLPAIPIFVLQVLKQKITHLILYSQLLFHIQHKRKNSIQIIVFKFRIIDPIMKNRHDILLHITNHTRIDNLNQLLENLRNLNVIVKDIDYYTHERIQRLRILDSVQ